ncbi:hypothetical protein GGR57DRAFT_50763 [Xylariaceae sp. FL1272]|nr:hypothetical protein GGR57DRAFT_50763 [Xylariaceae sp. FL1272]
MGRLESLVSLALGRSPYDDEVVDGEGEDDPHEPPKQYNEKGRVTNPDTRHINRELIRAHNEVMHVIGVAEPENPHITALEHTSAKLHNDYETDTGRQLRQTANAMLNIGMWGLYGIRQRNLVYRETARLPFFEMMQREVKIQSPFQVFLGGMPASLSAWSLQYTTRSSDSILNSKILRAMISYVRFHLHIYAALQQLNLIPGIHIFPTLGWFIPFSNSSPFIAPPLLHSPEARSLSEWAGKIALNLAPYAAFYLLGHATDVCRRVAWRYVHRYIPQPWPGLAMTSVPNYSQDTPYIPESPTLGATDHEIRHRASAEVIPPEPLAVNGDEGDDAVPIEAIRRQGTFSSRAGEDYATDDEDTEMVNPTLISFDVDTSESTEAPAGVWSAELRPSFNGDSRSQPREHRTYLVNALTCLPSSLAASILANTLTGIIMTPLSMITWRAMARVFSLKFGLPLMNLCRASLTSGLSTRMILNVFQTQAVIFIATCEIWAVITIMAQRSHISTEEWKEYQKDIERDIERELEEEIAAEERAEAEQVDAEPNEELTAVGGHEEVSAETNSNESRQTENMNAEHSP